MKFKTLLFAALCTATVSTAQITAKVGPEVGFGISSMVAKATNHDDTWYGGGFVQFGGTGDIQFGRWFAIRPSVMFNFNSVVYSESSYSTDENITINTNNIYLPVDFLGTFRFRNGSKMFLGFGPYLMYTVSGRHKYHDYDSLGYWVAKSEKLQLGSGEDKDLKPLDLGLNFKIGFQLRNNLFLNCSFNVGLTNRAPVTDYSYKIKDQQLFAFGIGYLFGPKEEADRGRRHSHGRRR
ncbi:porin family protein [Chitinophagaceae bacterium MMS25-I14]